ncbi:MAG: FAD-dependent oxidoreductase [Sedimentisphaerales bacterium]|nr:FAD-dependent oxidoreductase [Sedimentisphaerales bacterium]
MTANWKFKLDNLKNFHQLCSELDCRLEAIEDVSVLSHPVKVGSLTIPNSIAVHPMEGADGDSLGRPGPLTIRRYKRFAAGGAGLLWAEAIAVVSEGRANPRQLWLNENSKDAFTDMVKQMRRAAKDSMGPNHRPFIVAQLTHSGRYSKPAGVAAPIIPQRDPYRDPLIPEPSPTTKRKSKVTDDRIVTDEYLDNLQDAYIKAAKIAFQAGFDAVDIKSCHGYLINELLAARERKGKYGGSFGNRTRFVLEVIEKIHKELGDDKEVVARLGFYDSIPYPYGWGVDKNDYTIPDLTEPKQLVSLMVKRGVKMINFTIANPYYNPHVGRPFNQPIKDAYDEPEHPIKGVHRMINIAAKIQHEFPQLALVGTGYSWLRELMGNVGAAAKKSGKITIVGAGRMAFAYPDFAKDLLTKGKLDKDKVCVGCSACTQLMRDGQMAGCVVRDNKIYGPIFKHGRLSDPANLKRLAETCMQCQEPTCQLGCPAGIDIPEFINKFLEGDEKGAYETIRKANILPEVCAWLCPVDQQCQGSCLQKFIGDDALPIADIQRYLSEQANKNGWSKINVPKTSTGKNIAVLGAGPAGIAAAAVLLEAGHKITIFDKSDQFGGMIDSVIPPERQSTALKKEIAGLFADVPNDRMFLRLGTELNENFDLDDIIKENFDAVFIGMGLPKSIRSSGETLDGLYDALDFLKTAAKEPGKLDLAGKRVAVIGGGNTAMDAAATAKHLGAEDVHIIYRRSFRQMPAWGTERDRTLQEGIHFLILTQQLGYDSDNGRLTAIKVCPTTLGLPDKSGRRKPIPITNNEYKLQMDIAIEAIGQISDESLGRILPGVDIDSGLIKTDDKCHTTRKGVFAGGDLARGPSTVVAAVADGMKAAKQINEYLK